MSIRNYAQWSRKYVTTFGMDKTSDLHMVALWEPVFESAGYGSEELDYALGIIAKNPPEYRTEHLRKIHEVIGEQRRRESSDRQRDQDAIDGFEECQLCQGSGVVIVPHIRFVIQGVWNTYPGAIWKPVFAVSCRCREGTRVAQCPRRTMMMGIDKYDGLNPNWERQVAGEAKARSSQEQAQRVAQDLDQQLGAIVSGIGAMPKEERPKGREKEVAYEPNSTWSPELDKKWPHLRRPGPQPENQIAATFQEQFIKIHDPGKKT